MLSRVFFAACSRSRRSGFRCARRFTRPACISRCGRSGAEELQDAFMQETIARIPASETVVHVTRDELGERRRDTAPAGIIFHVARCGSTLISQSLKQLDNLVGLCGAAARQRDPGAASQMAARRTGCRASRARRRLCPPRGRAVRAEAEQLEHAVLRHRDGGLPGDELGAESARSGRGRRVAPAAAARMAQRHDGGVARPDRDHGAGGWPGVTRRARGTRVWRVLRGGGTPRPETGQTR